MMFIPHRVPWEERRVGDIIVWKRNGWIANTLSWLIQKIKQPEWDRWGWHTTPIIADNIQMDAQFPRVRPTTISGYTEKGRVGRVYRIMENEPFPEQIKVWSDCIVGQWYDLLVYILTAIAQFVRPKYDFPRIINRRYTCWEVVFDFADTMGIDISDDYIYPFLTDILILCGDLKGDPK